jgi:uncharacterized protein with HEPN domain
MGEMTEEDKNKMTLEQLRTRNILVHHYFEIELERVWNVVQNDLPVLKQKIEEILSARD